MYTVRVSLLALLLVLSAGTANGQAPLPPEQAGEMHKQAEDAQHMVQNAQNFGPVAPNAVKEMHDMNPAPALWVLYETTTWITVGAVLVLFVLTLVGLVRWYQRHTAPADPVKVALSDPWVRANLGRLEASPDEPLPPAAEAPE